MRHQSLTKAFNENFQTSSQSSVEYFPHICFLSYQTCSIQHEPPDANYEKVKETIKRKYLQQLIISLFSASERRVQNHTCKVKVYFILYFLKLLERLFPQN